MRHFKNWRELILWVQRLESEGSVCGDYAVRIFDAETVFVLGPNVRLIGRPTFLNQVLSTRAGR